MPKIKKSFHFLTKRGFSFLCFLAVIGIVMGRLCFDALSYLPILEGLMGDVFLFIPATMWFLPVFLFSLGSLFSFSAKKGLILLICWVILLFVTGFQWSFPTKPASEEGSIRVVSSNRGQSQGAPLWPFVKDVQADIIVLQEVGALQMPPEWKEQNKTWHQGKSGNFVLLSQYPIQETEPLRLSTGDPNFQFPGVRFVLERSPGQYIVVYNLHAATLRSVLQELRGSLWKNTLRGEGVFSSDYWARLDAFSSGRGDSIRFVFERIAREKHPFIIAGDLNCPPRGSLHRLLSEVAQDTFEEKGRGFGWTFPGESNYAITLYGPALRIDYIFTSNDFVVHNVQVEPQSHAQHRAVFAELSL